MLVLIFTVQDLIMAKSRPDIQLKTQTVVIYFLSVPRPGQYATFLTLFLTQQLVPDNQHHAPGPFLQSNMGFDKLLEKLFGTEAIVIVN